MERYLKCNHHLPFIQCTIQMLQKMPGQLVFGRDMILNIIHRANWEYIRQRKQERINKNNERENKKRIPHNYQVGDLVLLKVEQKTNMKPLIVVLFKY